MSLRREGGVHDSASRVSHRTCLYTRVCGNDTETPTGSWLSRTQLTCHLQGRAAFKLRVIVVFPQDFPKTLEFQAIVGTYISAFSSWVKFIFLFEDTEECITVTMVKYM